MVEVTTSKSNRTTHPLHQVIGDLISEDALPGCRVVRDRACSSDESGKKLQYIPLFSSLPKAAEVEYCNTDMLVIKNSKVRVFIEIEETGIRPTKICGKMLTAALTRYYVHGSEDNQPIEVGDEALFVQILKTVESDSRLAQWGHLRDSIREVLPVGRVSDYCLMHGTVAEFEGQKGRNLINHISKFTSQF